VKIVLDTNILVSALITPFGNAARILDMVLRGALQVLYDDRIICEYREVLLRPKFSFGEKDVDDLLAFLETEGMKVNPAPLDYPLIDKDDVAFIEVATVGSAEAVITGNKRHFKGIHIKEPIIMTPDEFIKFKQRKHSK
jgi:putative PIN family toxin of toxin-antitoxin system